MASKLKFLKCLLLLALFEPFAAWLLIIFYITGLELVWAVNIVFIIITIVLGLYALLIIKITGINFLFLLMIGLSLIKMLTYIFYDIGFEKEHLLSYSFGLVMPFLALNFTSTFNSSDVDKVYILLYNFSKYYLIIGLSAIITYAFFYFTGEITYFGLGVNLHYAYPFFIIFHKISIPILFLFIILISGKRAVLINYLTQTALYFFGNLKQRPLFFIFIAIIFFFSLLLIFQYTNLLDRFKWIFEDSFDLEDVDFMYRSLGGRYEEILGIIHYFIDNPAQILFGSPPGAFYIWEVQDYVVSKNYAHITLAGLVFRYGIVFSISLYIVFLMIILKRWSPKNPLFLVFIGIFSSSFFGANLIIDPISWLFIGFILNPNIYNAFNIISRTKKSF